MASRQTGGRSRAIVFLVVSGIAAVLAVLVIYRVIQSYQNELAEAEKPEETVEVVIAARTVYQGRTLVAEDLAVKEIAPAYVPETVFHSLEEVIGRVPAERIIEGEYVRGERLAAPEAGVGLNAIVPKGQRAVSIDIDGGSAVSGFLNPGNYVDILVTITDDKGVLRTITLLQARKLLAVNSRLGADEAEGAGRDGARHSPSVTMAVTPEEAEKLTHAVAQGRVTLTLRNDVDVTQVATNGAKVDKLLGKEDKVVKFVKVQPRKKVGSPPPAQIEIYKGTKGQTVTYPGQGGGGQR